MVGVEKREFDLLKKDHQKLRKAHKEVLEYLDALSDELRGLIDTVQRAKDYGEDMVSKRLQVHYRNVNGTHLNISRLMYKM